MAHQFRLLPPFMLLRTGILRWLHLCGYYLDLAIDHLHSPHHLIPPHALRLHHRHFNLHQSSHSLPFLSRNKRNFANSAFNFNSNNKLLITYNNKLSSILPSILSFPPTSSFFPRPPSRLHLPNHPPFLHPPTPPPPLQHQHPRSRNPPIFLFPFSPLQRPPNLQHPIKLIPLLIAQLVQ